MTRERKLAIKMWKEVKKQLPGWYKENHGDIVADLKRFKLSFCFHNDLWWKHECWFCQYFRGDCGKCPLRSCDYLNPLTAWYRIVDEGTNLEIKLQAVDEIIAALKGGLK